MTQPEALRLAEQLEAIGLHGPVAAELRRLHAERVALLEALRPFAETDLTNGFDVARARITIAMVEGEGT